MGWFTWFAVVASFAMSVAFNLYMADAILRLRNDVQITRKRVYGLWRRSHQGGGAGDDATARQNPSDGEEKEVDEEEKATK